MQTQSFRLAATTATAASPSSHNLISSYKKFGISSLLPVSRPRRLSIRCGVQFRPCIDIHKGKVKQIVGSTLSYSKENGSPLVTNFESDKSAAEHATIYKGDGLKGGHVIMLGADPLSMESALGALHAYPDFSSAELTPRMASSRWFAGWRWH